MTALALLYCPPLQGKEPVLLSTKAVPQPVDSALPQLTPAQQAQAQDFITQWQQSGVSRYNRYHDATALPPCYVLLILQHGQSKALQQQMLAQARQLARLVGTEDGAETGVKTGAVVLVCDDTHRKVSLAPDDTVQLYQTQQHHGKLLANAQLVVTADSWLGFEALLWGKTLYSFLPSFYSGLSRYCGNTPLPCAPQPTLQQWVWQLFFQYGHSVNPEQSGQAFASPIAALHWLAEQRSVRQRFAPKLYAIGFNYHWRRTLQAFLPGSQLSFVRQAAQVPAHSDAVIWGRRDIRNQLAPGVRLLRLEDGFLRSVGLGMQFARPLSWVADSRGLYFDATTTSDLEQLLAQHELGRELQQRAEALMAQLVANGISKYNTGSTAWQGPVTTARRILVPGQVESDASIAYGCSSINTNLALLQQVRAANPDAFIIYKPHPDVLAGARAQGENEQHAAKFCDLLLENVSIASVIAWADEVHVLTSLAGFEALLRGKTVHCYGMPFYAGWGLTVDHSSNQRRQRQLSLSQLVAASLLLYPLYLSRVSGYYCSAEQTLTQLCQWRSEGITLKQRLGSLARRVINRILGAK